MAAACSGGRCFTASRSVTPEQRLARGSSHAVTSSGRRAPSGHGLDLLLGNLAGLQADQVHKECGATYPEVLVHCPPVQSHADEPIRLVSHDDPTSHVTGESVDEGPRVRLAYEPLDEAQIADGQQRDS